MVELLLSQAPECYMNDWQQQISFVVVQKTDASARCITLIANMR